MFDLTDLTCSLRVSFESRFDAVMTSASSVLSMPNWDSMYGSLSNEKADRS